MNGYHDLYSFWGDSIYSEIVDDSHTIINLASTEYSKCVEKYLHSENRYITFIFGELDPDNEDKVVQKGVYCKMARGEMVRFLAENNAKEPEQAKDFKWGGYHFDEPRSDENNYYFVRK